jgi:hypothetical protein
MATTTPNFGWPVPTSTDLVKDGATAIEALGDGIDASLVDLKGGLTGQVLAKTTNTDMDFTWVTTDDANAIQNAIVNAKGDIIGASANDVPAITSVGANGEMLFADSTTATGLRYQGSIAAGKNFLINGGFDIWQRGTTFSVGTFSATYTADRWSTFNANACTVSQETSIIPTGSRYAFKVTGGATTSGYEFVQAIETSNAVYLAGKTITFSLQVAGTSGKAVVALIDSSTSTDVAPWPNAGWTNIANASVTTAAGNAYSTLKVTATIASNVKSLRVRLQTGTLTSGEVQYYGKAQLELGSVETEFSRAGSTIAGELALCQRYYYRTAGQTYGRLGNGIAASTTAAEILVQLPATMRTNPASVDFSTLLLFDSVNASTVTNVTLTSVAQSRNVASVTATVASGLTQYRPYILANDNSTAAYIGFSAEL